MSSVGCQASEINHSYLKGIRKMHSSRKVVDSDDESLSSNDHRDYHHLILAIATPSYAEPSDSIGSHSSSIIASPAQSEEGSDGSDSLPGYRSRILALAASSEEQVEDSDGSDSLPGYRSRILALAASSEKQVEDSDGSDSLPGYRSRILALAGSSLENDSEPHAPHSYRGHYSVQDSAGSDSTEGYLCRIFDLAQAASYATGEDSVSDNPSATGSSFHLDDAPYSRQSSPAQVDMDCQEDPIQLSVLDRQEMSSMPLQFMNTIYADNRSTKRCGSFYT
jgi:hypothetical protein